MIKRASQFSVPQSWKVLLDDMDIDPQLGWHTPSYLPTHSFERIALGGESPLGIIESSVIEYKTNRKEKRRACRRLFEWCFCPHTFQVLFFYIIRAISLSADPLHRRLFLSEMKCHQTDPVSRL